VGVLGEHTARVTRVVPAPDHAFFITGSDDGTVKVWDTARLERNVTHRSRQTYRLSVGVGVTSLCFVEATHTFICTGRDGSVHAVRVDVSKSNGNTRYGKLRLIREWQIPATGETQEHAVWSDHYRTEAGSTLVLATNEGRILGLDLRHMTLLFALHNPAHHGMPTTFCMSRRRDWLLLGTAHGVLDLWDIRFQLRIRSWTFADPSPITRLQLLPGRKTSKRNRFCMTGGTAPGDVTVWDPEKCICHEVYRSAHGYSKHGLRLQDYELRNLDEEKAEGLLSRVAGTIGADSNKAEQNSNLPNLSTCTIFGSQPSPKDSEASNIFAVTGGPDSKVRFWDCDRLDGCRLVSGGSPDDKPSSYTFSNLGMDTRVLSERLAGQQTGAMESNKVPPSSAPKRNAAAAIRPSSRYDTIRLSGQNLLGGHLDLITDVAVVERPFGMVVSAERSGRVFVYQ